MRTEDSFWLRSMVSALAVFMIVSALPTTAAELRVTNDGADSATCGSTSPCRSISQAIENASDGDTIQVGAGRYGSVSGDVNFGRPGDEHPMGVLLDGGGPGGCILCITKAVQLYSIHGASVTVIEGIPGTPFGSNVMILADGAVFGAKDHGFTITGGNSNGLTIALPNPNSTITASVVRGTTVAGNVDIGDTTGFYFFGRPIPGARDCPPGFCLLTGQTLLSDNESIGNTTAFNFLLNTDLGPGQVIVRNNLTVGAGTGFAVIPGDQCQGCFEPISAGIVHLIDNVATHGNIGFFTNLAGPIEGNTASGNAEAGFMVFSPIQETFKSNSAIGNAGPGVIVNFSPDPFTVVPSNSGFATFGDNNFFGNDRNRPAIFLSVIGPGSPGINPGPSAHCGVLNVGALAALLVLPQPPPPSPVIVLQAGSNFWGSTSGPQPNGAGDAAGGVCDQNGGVTVAKPAATTDFAITSWP